MKKTFTLLLLCLTIGYCGFAQTLTAEQAAKKIGDSVKVCGKIFGGRYFETSNGSPTLLNMDAAFPASPLTIMIPGELRSKLGYAPEIKLKDKNMCVTGTVILFKNKPEIIIYSERQMQVD